MLLTMIISVPTSLLFLNWLGTLWRGAARMTTPMLFCVGLVFTFGIGGLTGPLPGGHRRRPVPARHLLRRRALPPDHGGGAADGVVRGRLFLVPEDVRPDDERAARQAALLADVPVAERGVHRPAADRVGRHAAAPLRPVGVRLPASTCCRGTSGSRARRTCWALSQLVFVWNFFASLRRGKPAPANPWEVGTLEWTVPSPPPHHNFDDIPTVVRGPHELGHPDARRARQGLAGRRTRCCREPRASSRAPRLQRRRRHDGVPGRVRDAVRGAAVRVRGRAQRRRRPGRRRARRRFRAAPPPSTAFC